MNIKFSQFPISVSIKSTDRFPILSDGNNKIAPISTIYEYMSGNSLVRLYTSYSSNSAYLIQSASLANRTFTTYSGLSSFYLLTTNPLLQNWNSVYSSVNSISSEWNESTNYVEALSTKAIFSDSTIVPNSSAIKNIVAITQTNYNALTFRDPETFYVIAS